MKALLSSAMGFSLLILAYGQQLWADVQPSIHPRTVECSFATSGVQIAVEGWQVTQKNARGSVSLALSRQDLKVFDGSVPRWKATGQVAIDDNYVVDISVDILQHEPLTHSWANQPLVAVEARLLYQQRVIGAAQVMSKELGPDDVLPLTLVDSALVDYLRNTGAQIPAITDGDADAGVRYWTAIHMHPALQPITIEKLQSYLDPLGREGRQLFPEVAVSCQVR